MKKYEFYVNGMRYVVEAESRTEAAKILREQLNS